MSETGQIKNVAQFGELIAVVSAMGALCFQRRIA